MLRRMDAASRCAAQQDCRTCNRESTCAWCASSGSCLPRTEELSNFMIIYPEEAVVYNAAEYRRSYGYKMAGVAGTVCNLWVMNSSTCPHIENYCSAKRGCESCLTRAGCGYCQPTSGAGSCVPGSSTGQLVLSSKTVPCAQKSGEWIFGNWPKLHNERRWENMCDGAGSSVSVTTAPRGPIPPSTQDPQHTTARPTSFRPKPTRPDSTLPLDSNGEPIVPELATSKEDLGKFRDADSGLPLGVMIVFGLVAVCAVAVVYCLICKMLKSSSGQSSLKPSRSDKERAAAAAAARIYNLSEEDPEANRRASDEPPVSARGKLAAKYGRPAQARRPSQNDVRTTADIKIEMDDSKSSPRDSRSSASTAFDSDGTPQTTRTSSSSRSPSSEADAVPRRASSLPRQTPGAEPPPAAKARSSSAERRKTWSGPASQAPPPQAPPPKAPPPRRPSSTRGGLPPPLGLPECAMSACQIVYAKLVVSASKSESDRKAILRALQREWHPDKNPPEKQEECTAVFQYINDIGPVFLKG